MTEKRFYLLNYNNYPIYDSLNDKEYNAQFKKQRENLCDLLNEQHETIEELEKDNKEYIRGLDLSKATSQAWASDVRELREQNCQLEKENEQLKQDKDLFAQCICDLSNLLYENKIEHKLPKDIKDFITVWRVRVE